MKNPQPSCWWSYLVSVSRHQVSYSNAKTTTILPEWIVNGAKAQQVLLAL